MDDDEKLLIKALETLEYVTYHDGRYQQVMKKEWQHEAQCLVQKLAARLRRKPYRGYGSNPE